MLYYTAHQDYMFLYLYMYCLNWKYTLYMYMYMYVVYMYYVMMNAVNNPFLFVFHQSISLYLLMLT